MTSPTEFAPLVTDYELDWDKPGACGHDECAERAKDFLQEGEHYEHAFVHLENGYTVSLIRMDKDGQKSLGFEDGHWEATIGREAHPLVKMLYGVEFTPVLDVEEQLGGFNEDHIVGPLDNAAVNQFLARAAGLPAVEDEVPTEDLGGLF